MEDQLLSKLRAFFAAELERDRSFWPTASFFLCRHDGVLVHAQRSLSHPMTSNDEQSVGVLIGGVWQAACALMGLIPEKYSPELFRLSFDTAERGVYLLPLGIAGRSFYIGTIFVDEVNPAHMKAKIRNLVGRLEKEFSHLPENTLDAAGLSGPGRSDKNGEYLFKDLSDDEVDRLFSVAGI